MDHNDFRCNCVLSVSVTVMQNTWRLINDTSKAKRDANIQINTWRIARRTVNVNHKFYTFLVCAWLETKFNFY